MALTKGLVFPNENFGFGIMSKYGFGHTLIDMLEYHALLYHYLLKDEIQPNDEELVAPSKNSWEAKGAYELV